VEFCPVAFCFELQRPYIEEISKMWIEIKMVIILRGYIERERERERGI